MDGYGHGLSAKPDPQEEVAVDIILQIYKEFISMVIEKEKINNFGLIGRSLGGYVTHMLAQTFEKNLLAIGLIAPGGASKVPESLKNWTKNISVLWDSEDPVVGFKSYSFIDSTVKQCKLFVIGTKVDYKIAKIQPRDTSKTPSHVPELDYPQVFESFLISLQK